MVVLSVRVQNEPHTDQRMGLTMEATKKRNLILA